MWMIYLFLMDFLELVRRSFTDQGVEIFRLIMNLIPLNALCKPLAGDVDTLPSWGTHESFVSAAQ